MTDPRKASQRRDVVRSEQRQMNSPPNQFYKVLLTATDSSFEFAEHRLSQQLLFVFRGLPNLDMAGKLEAMGFDRTDDERVFAIDSTAAIQRKALKLAQQFSGRNEGMKR